MKHKQGPCCREAANHQLPIPVASWIIWIASTEESSSLRQNVMQTRSSICSIILNDLVTQYTCSLNGISHPHWLLPWSHHCSHMCIPVHSPWRPAYIYVVQTSLVILTMAGHFPDRPHIYTYKGVKSNSAIKLYIKKFVFIINPKQFRSELHIHFEVTCHNTFSKFALCPLPFCFLPNCYEPLRQMDSSMWLIRLHTTDETLFLTGRALVRQHAMH